MHSLLPRGRGKTPFLVATIATGAVLLLAISDPYYPIGRWLLWHYLMLLGFAAFTMLAAFSLGDWLLRHVFRLNLPTHERFSFAFALGLFSFEIGMFLLGVVGAYRHVTFFVYPALLVALGLPEWRNHYRRWLRIGRLGPKLSAAQVLFVLFGCLAIGLIYFSILTPANVQFDARWKHMALAEDYVAHGGLRRMPEGWVFAARPHLTSYLYAWAFLLPIGTLFHRMELCAHLEFLVFLVTTFFGIAALMRRMLPNIDPRVAWIGRFLFPGVLLYDSSLSAGADHFGALLAPAIAIATLRCYRHLERGWVWLLIVLLSAAVMVKETLAIMLVPLPVAMLGLRALWLILNHDSKRQEAFRLLRTLGFGLVLGLITTAPFWLKNWIWYRNPVYPSLSHLFASKPWSSMADYRFNVEYSESNMWAPKRTLMGALESLGAIFNFSFWPNDWSKFHGDRPIFGSLFTLLLPALLWLRGTKRIWAIVGWVHVALLTWYWVHHQDRYLQAILPMIAACTSSIIVLLWRKDRAVRIALSLLVAVQLALGADVYFIQTHAMTGSAVKRVVDLLALGHQGKFDERFVIEQKYVALADAIPKGKRILFHDMQAHLGSEHEGVRDVALWQSGLNYSLATHPNDIHRWLKEMGVNYIVLNAGKSSGSDRVASDLLFFDFVYRYTKRERNIEGMHVFSLPDTLFNVPYQDKVVVVTCEHGSEFALHNLSALKRPGYGPLSKLNEKPLQVTRNLGELRNFYSRADFAVVGAKCDVPADLTVQFKKVAERNKRGSIPACHLYIRHPTTPDFDDS